MSPTALNVWGSNISRDFILQKISLLALQGGVREGLRAHSLATPLSGKHILTVQQEAEIAGNLAFLSRRRQDSKSVAAIGIEEEEDGQGMVVRVCVNGDTLSRVEEGLKRICGSLERISRRENSELQDIDGLLQVVIELDATRISTRLKLAKRYNMATPYIVKLHEALLEKHRVVIGPEVREKLNTLVHLYSSAKENSAHATEASKHLLLKEIVKTCHELTRSLDFNAAVDLLQASDGDATKWSNLITKLGQYYRATTQLVLAARRKRYRIFRSIKVQTFQINVPQDVRIHTKTGSSIPLFRSLSNHVEFSGLMNRLGGSEARADGALVRRLNNTRSAIKIHAEIKLLVFYELHPTIRRPRIISANKSSCFLCDLFFKIHGVFQVPDTFGMLNERWILPDWCSFAPERMEHMKQTLIQFNSALDLQLIAILRGRARQPDPMQSLVALSASWPGSHDTMRPLFEVHIDPPSVYSYSSSILPSMVERRLNEGDAIWKPLCELDSTIVFHFYEGYVIISGTGGVQDTVNDASWVRLQLKSKSDSSWFNKNHMNLVSVKDIGEGVEKQLPNEALHGDTRLVMYWKDLAMCVLIRKTRSKQKRIDWTTASL